MSLDEMPCGCLGHADNEELCKYPKLEVTVRTLKRKVLALETALIQVDIRSTKYVKALREIKDRGDDCGCGMDQCGCGYACAEIADNVLRGDE